MFRESEKVNTIDEGWSARRGVWNVMGLEYIVCATIMIFTAMIIMIKIMIILIIVVIIMLEICHNFDDSPAMLRFKIWA